MKMKVFFTVLLAMALNGQASADEPIPSDVLAELQGVWVSRFEGQINTIEVKGDQIYILVPAKNSNPHPVGWLMTLTGVKKTYLTSSTGADVTPTTDPNTIDKNFNFSGTCNSWNGQGWAPTETPSCSASLSMYYKKDVNWKLQYKYRSFSTPSDSYYRPSDKKKLFP